MILFHMENYLAPCFRALSDPTRLGMVARLARGPASVGELAAPSGLGLPTVLKHLKALEDGGLVISVKSGRHRLCRLNPGQVTQAQHWLASLAATWEARLDRMEVLAATLDQEEKPA